jgi:hypothetical protein
LFVDLILLLPLLRPDFPRNSRGYVRFELWILPEKCLKRGKRVGRQVRET